MDYAKHYQALMDRARGRALTGYTEKHHILPRCLGGSNRWDNIAVLTAREHFLAHLLLVKLYPRNGKLIGAAMLLTRPARQVVGKVNNRLFGWLREAHAASLRGKKHSPERVAKVAASQRGKVISEAQRAKISASLTGKKQSAETRAKRSARLRGNRNAVVRTADHRAKLSAAKRGKAPQLTPEQRARAWRTRKYGATSNQPGLGL